MLTLTVVSKHRNRYEIKRKKRRQTGQAPIQQFRQSAFSTVNQMPKSNIKKGEKSPLKLCYFQNNLNHDNVDKDNNTFMIAL